MSFGRWFGDWFGRWFGAAGESGPSELVNPRSTAIRGLDSTGPAGPSSAGGPGPTSRHIRGADSDGFSGFTSDGAPGLWSRAA